MMASVGKPFSLNKALFTPRLYRKIFDIWFEGIPATATIAPESSLKKWFGIAGQEEREQFDKICRASANQALESIRDWTFPAVPDYATEIAFSQALSAPFIAEIQEAEVQMGDDVVQITPSETALSLLLLLDQYPRNIYRKDQRLIYGHYDILSRSLCRAILQMQPRPDLHPRFRQSTAYRWWFCMPLMHSEHLEDHDIFTKLNSEMASDIDEAGDNEAMKFMKMGEEFEEKHRVILEQFGRYPYRNKVMGRESTEEEERWLKEGGQTFGTS
ncbi:DUF924-domain-containing protein [Eremomyces bilateralis CBS 781.70]|uniref:DUF924-domain-containing protein n=1 Tax=Eremomyces bilateralis CBS 781.70 TaxID=1392243 RepID=A0A6G1FS08_9PEZI|nr:DUF924-domain-containing protein [Eremomyces bilateralis CBS 781.70]KAF1808500.1 DUF924-domain-containing protein [Eremomyces bilateralis CBS 781.70]